MATLSDEARLLQRLADPQLPPEATDSERAAARAEAAHAVESAVNELGGRWIEAYQELRPDWQLRCPSCQTVIHNNIRERELFDTSARARLVI